MFNFWKKYKLVTHNSGFHADDVFATATLFLLLGENNCKVYRTRDIDIIKKGDFVYDIGGIYDSSKNKFDHHQKDFSEKRENGITYSSFGLVWKKFGKKVCGSQKIADEIERKIVMPVDAMDNGLKIYENIYKDIHPYLFYDMVYVFNPTWLDDENGSNKLFLGTVRIEKKILEREIIKLKQIEEAEKEINKIYKNSEDKRVIILDKNYPYETIINKYPEPLFIIIPKKDRWNIKTVKDDIYSFESRAYFPESWAGKRDEQLEKETGVKGALFCHNARFFASAKTKEAAIALVKLSLSKK